MLKIDQELFNYIKKLKIIDTHEHLPTAENKRDKNTDVLKEYLLHYFSSDLISSGLNKEDYKKIINEDLPIRKKWKIVEPYWEMCRYTGYGRALNISVKELYNIDKIDSSTIEELNYKFKETINENQFEKVLKKKSNIEISLLDNITENTIDCDERYFRNVVRIGDLVNPKSGDVIRKMEKRTGIKICSLDDWLKATENYLNERFKKGAVALKNALAYERSLNFKQVSKHEAEKSFIDILKKKISTDWERQSIVSTKGFQDYMMHYILNYANEYQLPFQIHTGLQEGNGNIINNSDPSLLNNLFIQYPDVNFDIFHIGYPYYQILASLAKMFPNVYIDMCWVHIISPEASKKALSEYLDSVPVNKISAFGGDYLFVDGVYGHQYMARKNVAQVLTGKIDLGIISLKEAKKIAKLLFYENPKKIFNLNNL